MSQFLGDIIVIAPALLTYSIVLVAYAFVVLAFFWWRDR